MFAQRHKELEVWKRAFASAMRIYELTKGFPFEERYSLSDQIRRSSRSVTANLAEAWQRRRYPASWSAKLTDCAAEAAETQSWLDYALACGYIDASTFDDLDADYESLIRTLNSMACTPEKWCIKQ